MRLLYCPLFILLFAIPVLSQWAGDPSVNNPICTHSSYQYDPAMTTDGSGGAIITWGDDHNTGSDGYNYDIYAQRIDANGNVKWTVDGIGVCMALHAQLKANIASDNAGGAIIIWEDSRNSSNSYTDIYAQRIDGNGNALWTTDGVRVTSTPTVSDINNPVLISDGGHGAIVAWEDFKTGSWRRAYAQKLDPTDGHLLWAADGLQVCPDGINGQDNLRIISDGGTGAIVSWSDVRTGSYVHVYAQKIDNTGALLWSTLGAVVSAANYNQYHPILTTDGNGGGIWTWTDDENYVYAQRLNSSGTAMWAAGGVTIANVTTSGYNPDIVDDGTGGAYITWYENRNANPTFDDIFIQRVDAADGHSLWTANGVTVCGLTGNQYYARIAGDGSGGAIVTWADNRGSYQDLYAQRYDGSGNALWTANGTPVCTSVGSHIFAVDNATQNKTILNTTGGTIICWIDERSGYQHIYCTKLNAAGLLPVELTSFTANFIDNKIKLNWATATEVNNMGFDVERSLNNGIWNKIAFIKGSNNSNSTKNYSYTDLSPVNGKIEYRLKQIDVNGSYKYSNTIEVSTAIPANFSLAQNFPNPFNPTTVIHYSIPKAEYVSLKVYDELGNEAATLVNENKDAGSYKVSFNGANLSSGIYFYKINAGEFSNVKKLILIK